MLLQQLINGLTQGSLYALVAIGFVIIFGTMNLVTFAHGEVYMVGAFMGYFALTLWNLPWPFALLMGMAAGWILGVLMEKMKGSGYSLSLIYLFFNSISWSRKSFFGCVAR